MEGGRGVERLTEKAERLLKLIERMSTGGRNRTTEKGLVNERVCLGERVRERRWVSQHVFFPPQLWQLGFVGLPVWPRFEESPGVRPNKSETHPVYHQRSQGEA